MSEAACVIFLRINIFYYNDIKTRRHYQGLAGSIGNGDRWVPIPLAGRRLSANLSPR